jgi:uncharacterized protein YehS (DUF1456 family)
MTNNDVLRRVRYTFDVDDGAMVAVFRLAGREVTRAVVSDWLKNDEDPARTELSDHDLAFFLNGFIIKRRGHREGPPAVAETVLTNNIILIKLKIALDLKADAMLEMICSGDLQLSRHELSAFSRKPGHKHYRKCMDQVLRNFLQGMQARYRPESAGIEQ